MNFRGLISFSLNVVVIVSMFTVAWIREYKAYSVFSKSIDKRNQTQFVFLYLLGSIFQETLPESGPNNC